MKAALLLALQAASAAAPRAAPGGDFDLAKYRPSAAADGRCSGRNDTEIVVCGRRGDGYRVKEMDSRYSEKPVRAEVDLGGGATAKAYLEQVELPGGQISRRVMVGVKTKF